MSTMPHRHPASPSPGRTPGSPDATWTEAVGPDAGDDAGSTGAATGAPDPGESGRTTTDQTRRELDLDALVDRGSWTAFTASLTRLLEQWSSPAPRTPAPAHLLLTTPAPVVSATSTLARRGLLSRLRGSRPAASPEVPGLVLSPAPGHVQLACPVLDEQGRYLLDVSATHALTSLGWQHEADLLTVRMPTEPAAQMVTRVLIEVLAVPHPADLDWAIEYTGYTDYTGYTQ